MSKTLTREQILREECLHCEVGEGHPCMNLGDFSKPMPSEYEFHTWRCFAARRRQLTEECNALLDEIQ